MIVIDGNTDRRNGWKDTTLTESTYSTYIHQFIDQPNVQIKLRSRSILPIVGGNVRDEVYWKVTIFELNIPHTNDHHNYFINAAAAASPWWRFHFHRAARSLPNCHWCHPLPDHIRIIFALFPMAIIGLRDCNLTIMPSCYKFSMKR